MNWSNVDLNSNYERDQNILDPYNFETLLLEISCNIKKEDLNKDVIKKHFLAELNLKIESAKTVFYNNLDNIVLKAIEEREDN